MSVRSFREARPGPLVAVGRPTVGYDNRLREATVPAVPPAGPATNRIDAPSSQPRPREFQYTFWSFPNIPKTPLALGCAASPAAFVTPHDVLGVT